MNILGIIASIAWLAYVGLAVFAALYGNNKVIGLTAVGIGLLGAFMAYFTGYVICIFIGMSIGSKLLMFKSQEVFGK